MTREFAQKMYEKFAELVDKLVDAKLKLVDGGVKSYTIGDRTLTRFDVDTIGQEIEDAIKKMEYYEAIANGFNPKKVVAVVPRDW